MQAIRAGADFILQPFDIDVVGIAIERAVKHGVLTREVQRLQRARWSRSRAGFDELLGASAMKRCMTCSSAWPSPSRRCSSAARAARAKTRRARYAASIEQAQQLDHSWPSIAPQCPGELLESRAIRAHQGRVHGRKRTARGLFVQAKGGTIFLDEIGDMPLGLQPKLLRALQERTVRPVGGDHETPIDVRVVAASNRDLETAIEERKFREDRQCRSMSSTSDCRLLEARSAGMLLLSLSTTWSISRHSPRRTCGRSTLRRQNACLPTPGRATCESSPIAWSAP